MENYSSTEETMDHKIKVKSLLKKCIDKIELRGINHDNSKLISPEKEMFDIYTPKLKNLTYGTEEYRKCLKGLGVALEHHYKNNRHHPEHYENGINDMSLIDLIEMIVDWKAASERHKNGNIITSIEKNKKRFKYDDLLANILKNTIKDLEE